jgi:hypothetical protein
VWSSKLKISLNAFYDDLQSITLYAAICISKFELFLDYQVLKTKYQGCKDIFYMKNLADVRKFLMLISS